MVNQLPQGWKEEELGKLADVIAGQSPEGVYYNTVGEGTPFYQGKSEFQEMYLGKPTKWTTKVTKLAKENDILMSVRAPVGPVNITQEDICIGRGLAAITAKSMLLQLYLFYHLRFLEDKISGTNGAVFASISKREIEQIKITYPTDKGEQKYIVDTLDAVAEMIKLRKKTIQLTKDLIPAIFQEMFGDPITNPKGWDKKDLGQVCDVRDGTHASPKFYPEGYPLITSKNLIDGEIDFSNVSFISEKDYAEINKRSFVDDGDILLAMIGTIGNPVIVKRNRDFAIKNVALIKFYKEDSEVTNTYIKSVLELVTDNLKLQSIGVTQKFISLGFLRKYIIPIPPITIQEEFADKVDQINKYIVAQQVELKHFETLFPSLLQEAFTGVLTWKYPRKENND